MKKLLIFILSWMAMLSAYAASQLANINSPVGYWRTIDDKTKQPKAIVQIMETKTHVLQGKIVHLFEKPERLCTLCQGDKHNQPMLGLTFLENLMPINTNEWGNGQILDPKNGKVYKCKLYVKENGQRLEVRGYLGIPLLGRTQVWERVNNANAPRIATGKK